MNPAVVQTASPPEWSAADLAQLLIDGAASPNDLSAEQALATAWALKEACYAAWSSQPQRAGPAAQAVAKLLARAPSSGGWSTGCQQELAAVARWTRGIAQITVSRMDEASATLEQAAQMFVALGQTQHAAQTQVPRIMALALAGKHAEAAACAEKTQQAFLQLGDTHSAGKVSLNLGGMETARDNHMRAAEHCRRAAVFFARSGDIEHSVMADIGLGKALSAMGEMQEASRIYARARMRADAHSLPVLRAVADEATAMLDLARGRFRDALQGFERARRSYETLAMPQPQAFAEVQLGEVYLELRLLPEAVTLFERAQSAMQSLGMTDEQAWTQLQLARALAMTDRQASAEPLLRQAAETFQGQDNQVGLASVRLAMAELALAQRQSQHAYELAAQAASSFEHSGQAEGRVRAQATAAHALLQQGQAAPARDRLARALRGARELQLVLVQVHCETGLGLAAAQLGRPDEARGHFESAITLFDEQRRALPCDEMRSALLADHLRPYLELLRMALDQVQPNAYLVLQRLDHLRARALSERLQQGRFAPGDADTHELRVRLNWLYRRLNGRNDAEAPSPALAAEMRRTELELLERARRNRVLDTTTSAPSDVDAFDAASLCSKLGHREVLVEYGVLDDELFACVVRRDGVQLVRRMASWREVLAAVGRVHFQVHSLRYGSTALADHMPMLQRRVAQHLRQVYLQVWQALASAVGEADCVLIVPHAELGTVPFAALHDGQLPLGQRHQLALAPSAQIALNMMSGRAAIPQRVLALGDSQRLLHAGHEAQAVAGMFAHGEALVDGHASVEALKTKGLQADVVHLACHAEFRRDNPMFSALHLADGPLTAELVEGLHLPSAVVVLSACETGLAGRPSGDELVGLVRAFLVAGARRVLATLWPVDDEATLEFMRHFYESLRAGQDASAALQTAQRRIRQDRPHPFYWAPFVLHGGW